MHILALACPYTCVNVLLLQSASGRNAANLQTNVPGLGGYKAKQRVAIAAEGLNAAAPVQIVKAAKPASVLAMLGMPVPIITAPDHR